MKYYPLLPTSITYHHMALSRFPPTPSPPPRHGPPLGTPVGTEGSPHRFRMTSVGDTELVLELDQTEIRQPG